MRKLFALLLVLSLAACAAPPVTPTQAPTEQVIQPTQTAAVIVQTVVVTVVPTNLPTETPTDVPTATPLHPTEVPPTQQPPTEQSASTATSAPAQAANTGSGSGPVTLEDALGGGWFKSIALTAKVLSLRCQPSKQITFSVAPSDPSITQADFYYRIEDRASGAVFDWQGPRRMMADANGNFTLVFTGEDVNPNFRKPNAWFDFQVVGLSKSGGRVGSTEKVVQQVSYTFDCP
jgi:hypothetical protein